MTVELAPRGYSDVRAIGDIYGRGDDVHLDLNGLRDDQDAQRIIDFAAGLTYGRGHLHRIRNRVFLVAHRSDG